MEKRTLECREKRLPKGNREWGIAMWGKTSGASKDTLENYREVSEANHSGKFPNKRSGKKREQTRRNIGRDSKLKQTQAKLKKSSKRES
jgi:hypothetical protein